MKSIIQEFHKPFVGSESIQFINVKYNKPLLYDDLDDLNARLDINEFIIPFDNDQKRFAIKCEELTLPRYLKVESEYVDWTNNLSIKNALKFTDKSLNVIYQDQVHCVEIYRIVNNDGECIFMRKDGLLSSKTLDDTESNDLEFFWVLIKGKDAQKVAKLTKDIKNPWHSLVYNPTTTIIPSSSKKPVDVYEKYNLTSKTKKSSHQKDKQITDAEKIKIMKDSFPQFMKKVSEKNSHIKFKEKYPEQYDKMVDQIQTIEKLLYSNGYMPQNSPMMNNSQLPQYPEMMFNQSMLQNQPSMNQNDLLRTNMSQNINNTINQKIMKSSPSIVNGYPSMNQTQPNQSFSNMNPNYMNMNPQLMNFNPNYMPMNMNPGFPGSNFMGFNPYTMNNLSNNKNK